jgi:hypothetical protein
LVASTSTLNTALLPSDFPFPSPNAACRCKKETRISNELTFHEHPPGERKKATVLKKPTYNIVQKEMLKKMKTE